MDYRGRRSETDDETPMMEMVDGAVRRIATSIAIAGIAIGLAIYARPGPPTYQAFSTGSSIVRVNMKTGWILECVEGRCGTVLRPGQDFDRRPPKAAPVPSAAQPKALPSPQATPAAAAPQRTPADPAPASETR